MSNITNLRALLSGEGSVVLPLDDEPASGLLSIDLVEQGVDLAVLVEEEPGEGSLASSQAHFRDLRIWEREDV